MEGGERMWKGGGMRGVRGRVTENVDKTNTIYRNKYTGRQSCKQHGRQTDRWTEFINALLC